MMKFMYIALQQYVSVFISFSVKILKAEKKDDIEEKLLTITSIKKITCFTEKESVDYMLRYELSYPLIISNLI